MADDADGDDFFSRLSLNEDFVRGADRRELTAEERLRRAAQERQVEEERRLWNERKKAYGRPHRRFKRSLRRGIGGLPHRLKTTTVTLLVLSLIGGAAYLDATSTDSTSIWAAADSPSTRSVDGITGPSTQSAKSDVPLGVAPTVSADGAPYLFISTQKGTSAPVAYDPCRPIQVVVNPLNAPAAGDRLIREAIDATSAATGLRFIIEGTTDEVASEERESFQPLRYGDRWAPVLIAWGEPSNVPMLKDDVAGFAGSSALSRGNGPTVYVSGSVVLDAPQFEKILDRKRGEASARSVIMHELAHLVGLDHVDDESQLMNPVGGDVRVFQSGDLAGLAQLGRGECVKQL